MLIADGVMPTIINLHAKDILMTMLECTVIMNKKLIIQASEISLIYTIVFARFAVFHDTMYMQMPVFCMQLKYNLYAHSGAVKKNSGLGM